MRKNTLISFLFAATVLFAAGCVRDIGEYYDPEVPLQFSPALQSMVKADGSSVYPADQSFNASLWQYAAESTWEDATIEPFVNAAIISWQDGTWRPESGATNWPGREKHLTVVAASPAGKADDIDSGNGVIFKIDNILYEQTDLLYSDLQTDLDKLTNGGVIHIPFQHALCQVDFRIKHNLPEPQTISIKSLVLHDTLVSGEFVSLRDPAWKTRGNPADVTFFTGDFPAPYTPEAIGASMFLLPQHLSSTIEVTFLHTGSNGKAIEHSIKTLPLNKTLTPGRHYTFTLSIILNDPDFKIEVVETQHENL